MTKQSLRNGLRIETISDKPEQAIIGRWAAGNGALKNHVQPGNGGWHVVNFSDGGGLIMHESRFRVIDNAEA